MEKEMYSVCTEVSKMGHERINPIVSEHFKSWDGLFSIDKVAKKAKIMGKTFNLKNNIVLFSDLCCVHGQIGIESLMCEGFEYELFEKLGYTKARDIKRISLVDKVKFSYIITKVVAYMKEESIHVKHTI